MKKKFLLIIMIIMLCAGCKAKYNITISKDGSVEEYISATETSEFYESYEHSSVGRVIGFILEPYNDILSSNNYEVSNIFNVDESGVILKKKYNNVEDYAKNTIFYSQFSNDKVKYDLNGNFVTLSIKGQFLKISQQQNRFAINDAYVSIRLPFKVKESNADKVSGDTYTWIFDKNAEEEREINIVYDRTKLVGKSDNTVIIVIVIIAVLLGVTFFAYKKTKDKREKISKF